MTILEELIDLALRTCENGRTAGQKHHARGAALLAPNGKVSAGKMLTLLAALLTALGGWLVWLAG